MEESDEEPDPSNTPSMPSSSASEQTDSGMADDTGDPDDDDDTGPDATGFDASTTNEAGTEAGAGGSTGSEAGTGGSSDGGSGGGGGCDPGEIECDGTCVPEAMGCEPACPDDCDLPNVANADCIDGECVINACATNFVDCDQNPDNGCEGDFDFNIVSTQTADTVVSVPRVDTTEATITSDALWAGIPFLRMQERCNDCSSNEQRLPLPPIGEPLPTRDDLRAGFALSWDDGFLYLRVRAFDNDVPPPNESGDARNFDNVEFVFDGMDTSVDDQFDQHVFLGLSGELAELNAMQGEAPPVSLDVVTSPAGCYTMTASFTTLFLSGATAGGPITLEWITGKEFHFNVAINDFDREPQPDAGSVIEHQAHLFFKNPGNGYWFAPRTLPRLRLTDGS